MFIKRILLFVISIVSHNSLLAQNHPISLKIVYTETVQIGLDSAQLDLKYVKFDNYAKKDISLLVIGDSSYYTYSEYALFRYRSAKILDSVSLNPDIELQQKVLLGEQAKLEPLKNFNILYAKKIGTNNFAINESTYDEGIHQKFFLKDTIEPIRWTLLPDTRQIDSFSCQKAEGKFRGRLWQVWFTSQVPIDAGPWKLSGLPGLIVEARDTSGKYAFICKSITSPIKQFDIKSTKLDRTVKNITAKKWQEVLSDTFKHSSEFFKSLVHTFDNSTLNNDVNLPETKKLLEQFKMTRAVANFVYNPIELTKEN